MKVSFVHCTPDAERLIVRMARVSNPDNANNEKTSAQLLRYLIKHEHWSPFEMASMCVQIETERDIAAQILRHKSFSFQEFSTRYARTTPAEIPYQRLQDFSNRQNSVDGVDPLRQQHWAERIGQLLSESYRVYQMLLDDGMAKETARRILPLCTPTTMYMHGTLRSWIHYINLRKGNGTQLEHQEIALECLGIFTRQFPVVAGVAFNAVP